MSIALAGYGGKSKQPKSSAKLAVADFLCHGWSDFHIWDRCGLDVFSMYLEMICSTSFRIPVASRALQRPSIRSGQHSHDELLQESSWQRLHVSQKNLFSWLRQGFCEDWKTTV
jgi:hypothetical protein